MKKLTSIIVLLALLLLSACGNSETKEVAGSSNGKSSEKVPLLLAAEGTAMYYAYIARDKGFFEDEGIEVELLPGKGGSYVVQQVGAETIDMGIIAVNSVLPAWDKGIDIKMVYQVNTTNLFDFMVPEDSKVTDIKQLKGKVIGVTDLGSGEVPMVRSILTSAGLNPDQDVTIRAIGADGTSILTAFEKGEIDAFSGGAHDLISLYGKGFKSRSLVPKEYKSIPSTGIIANGKIMEENPEIVEKITRAVAKATDFAINDPDAAYELMKKAVPEQYTDEEMGRLFLDTFIGLSTPTDPEKGYGYIYKDSWKKLVEQFSDGDDPVVKNKINLDEYLDSSLLEKANDF
ncbi:ABC transporter substrate-binding protein [Niallia oryzisoli]|uniref:Thiamine pyrimidine synthase n=1 Tax=Niallia oryzisoli TaxID=1737571 RepID=A0ABZ2CH67_9BACI